MAPKGSSKFKSLTLILPVTALMIMSHGAWKKYLFSIDVQIYAKVFCNKLRKKADIARLINLD